MKKLTKAQIVAGLELLIENGRFRDGVRMGLRIGVIACWQARRRKQPIDLIIKALLRHHDELAEADDVAKALDVPGMKQARATRWR